MRKGIRFEVDTEKLNEMKDLVRKEFLDNPDLLIPIRATQGSAGYDLKYPYKDDLIMKVNNDYLIESFVKIILPKEYVAKMYIRSSMGIEKGITLMNGTGIIDSDFSESIKIPIHTIKKDNVLLKAGPDTRIAQIVITKYETVDDDITTGIRNGGIGSTDKGGNESSSDNDISLANVQFNKFVKTCENIRFKKLVKMWNKKLKANNIFIDVPFRQMFTKRLHLDELTKLDRLVNKLIYLKDNFHKNDEWDVIFNLEEADDGNLFSVSIYNNGLLSEYNYITLLKEDIKSISNVLIKYISVQDIIDIIGIKKY